MATTWQIYVLTSLSYTYVVIIWLLYFAYSHEVKTERFVFKKGLHPRRRIAPVPLVHLRQAWTQSPPLLWWLWSGGKPFGYVDIGFLLDCVFVVYRFFSTRTAVNFIPWSCCIALLRYSIYPPSVLWPHSLDFTDLLHTPARPRADCKVTPTLQTAAVLQPPFASGRGATSGRPR